MVENISHYKCDQLIFTNRLAEDQQINQWCISALYKLFSIDKAVGQHTKPARVIWITRKGLGTREILWETEIATNFPTIKRVDLTNNSPDQTIALMQSAIHIFAPHGAGLSNIYLCELGTKVLEIYPIESYFQPCYGRLAEICSLEYKLLYLNFTDQNDPENGINMLISAVNKQLC